MRDELGLPGDVEGGRGEGAVCARSGGDGRIMGDSRSGGAGDRCV